MTESKICTCPSGDGSLRWPCPAHPAVDQADVAAKLTFINGRPAMCGCQVEYSDGGGEYSDVIYVTLCAKHSGSAILDLVATNRIALTPEYEGQWHADLYLDREIPLAKVEGATPAEAVLALMSAERIDPEQESVEQAGWDERAAFEAAFAAMGRPVCRADYDQDAYGTPFDDGGWTGWQARAALAQPSPPPHPAPELDFSRPLETENGDPVKWICADVIEYKSAHVCVAKDTGLVYSSPYIGLKIRNVMPEQAEAERPEVVGYLATAEHPKHGQPHKAFNYFKDQHDAQVAHWRERGCAVTEDRLMTVSQHDRIVGALRAKADQLREALEWRKENQAGQRELLRSVTAERDAAQARVAELESKLAELEKQEPVALANRGNQCFWVKWTEAAAGLYGPGIKLYAAPVAQAQQLNDLDKQCRDDVARALGLRPNQERGFAWSYLLASIKSCVKSSGDSAQAQHSVPDGAADLCRFLAKLYCELDGLRYSTAKLPAEQIADALIFKWPVLQGARNQLNIKRISEQPYDESKLHSAIAAMLAAAPGKEVGHE
ncbi:hypothetical protein [Pseudomonas aeruginosa]|uniref:hypothetical protein n=1 Tax=Pseudomonas aeruginosa TaxID=287 RepID=UPI0028807081|nr:hypothetical protein [Pseudomonas aeruginosa]